MFFDRFTEDARRAILIAKEEAANARSSHIEAEHLLLGIVRAIESDLKGLLRLKEVEGALRSDIGVNGQFRSPETPADLPLSNPGKRILAYAAEEAVRLNSLGIGAGHLLLGALRESESIAAHLLTVDNIDLAQARQIMAARQMHEHIEKSSGSIGLASRMKRRYWLGIAGQLALIAVLGVAVAKSTIAGRQLLLIAAVWLLAVLAWIRLGPSSFFLSLGKQNGAKVAAIYVFAWLAQVFMFGWLLPLSIGIYRVAVK